MSWGHTMLLLFFLLSTTDISCFLICMVVLYIWWTIWWYILGHSFYNTKTYQATTAKGPKGHDIFKICSKDPTLRTSWPLIFTPWSHFGAEVAQFNYKQSRIKRTLKLAGLRQSHNGLWTILKGSDPPQQTQNQPRFPPSRAICFECFTSSNKAVL